MLIERKGGVKRKGRTRVKTRTRTRTRSGRRRGYGRWKEGGSAGGGWGKLLLCDVVYGRVRLEVTG